MKEQIKSVKKSKVSEFVPNNPLKNEIRLTKRKLQEFRDINNWLLESERTLENCIVGESIRRKA